MTYNWQQENWPNFSYDLAKVEEKLYLFSEKIGTVSGVLKALPEDTQLSAIIDGYSELYYTTIPRQSTPPFRAILHH